MFHWIWLRKMLSKLRRARTAAVACTRYIPCSSDLSKLRSNITIEIFYWSIQVNRFLNLLCFNSCKMGRTSAIWLKDYKVVNWEFKNLTGSLEIESKKKSSIEFLLRQFCTLLQFKSHRHRQQSQRKLQGFNFTNSNCFVNNRKLGT